MPATTAHGSAEIRTLFLADHRRLDALLERLIAAFEANDREDQILYRWSDLRTGDHPAH